MLCIQIIYHKNEKNYESIIIIYVYKWYESYMYISIYGYDIHMYICIYGYLAKIRKKKIY